MKRMEELMVGNQEPIYLEISPSLCCICATLLTADGVLVGDDWLYIKVDIIE